jgi:pyruvate kinase
MRSTKIVATLGPATESPEAIRRLFEAGVDVFRCNASHGDQESRSRMIALVRAESKRQGRDAGVLLDLQGPKIRLGEFEDGFATLEKGAEFAITTRETLGNALLASTTYKDFARDVKPGDRVLLADGSVVLRVRETDGVTARCVVEVGGVLSNHKGINLPGVAVSTPALTEKDIEDLYAGLDDEVDMVALSFVRRKQDVEQLRSLLAGRGAKVAVVAKIEKPEAWTQVNEILSVTDGVMVARGDLGVEMPLERVPAIQKSIIRRARLRGKFAITATQMLETMIENPTPTRAEVSDVANAIYDGTDAVMLSAETSVGKYPFEAVRMMARIAEETDSRAQPLRTQELSVKRETSVAQITAAAACRAAETLHAKAIVVFTTTGRSARVASSYRPAMPIFVFTPDAMVLRQATVLYGTQGFVADELDNTDAMLEMMDRVLVERGRVKPGDMVVFVAGQPIGSPGSTNMMILHQVIG